MHESNHDYEILIDFLSLQTFGSIHVRYHHDDPGDPGAATMAPVGTTAEIYEFRGKFN